MRERENSLRLNRIRWLIYALMIGGCVFALYFIGLGSYPLVDPTEPVYGQVAKEMASGGSWLTPHYGGKIWFDKPPLFYWLSGLSVSYLGPTELGIRLPSAILATGLLLLTFGLVSYDFGRRTGFFSAAVMATCLQQIILARAAVTDMALVFCLTAALYAYRRWVGAIEGSRLRWAVLCGAMAGLGMLTKGPIAPVLLMIAFLIHLGWCSRLKRMMSLEVLAGILAFLLVGLPWYIAMLLKHGDLFIRDFILANNVHRFLQPEHISETGGWTSYLRNIPVLVAFFFPWSIFLPQALARHWRSNDGAKLATVWMAVVFIFFSISKTQLVTYIFPLYPCAALFVGNLWSLATIQEPKETRGIRAGLWVGLIISLGIGGVLWKVSREQYPEAGYGGLVLGGILIFSFILAIFWMRQKRPARTEKVFGVFNVGMIILVLYIVFGIMPLITERVSARGLVLHIPPGKETRVVAYRLADPRYILDPRSLLFYLPQPPEQTGSPDRVNQWLTAEIPVWVITRHPDETYIAVSGLSQRKFGNLILLANGAAQSVKGEKLNGP